MRARLLPLAISGLVTAFPAAADIRYDHIDGGYALSSVATEPPPDGDGDGLFVAASKTILGPVFAFGQYVLTDFSDDNVTRDHFEVGVGAHQPLGRSASVFVRAAYLYSYFDRSAAPNFDEDGYGISVGYRAINRSPWEFIGSMDYVNVESGVELGAGVTLTYDITRRFALTGGGQFFEGSNSGFLGFRFYLRPRF